MAHIGTQSGIQAHSAGPLFPYVIARREQDGKKSWHVIGPKSSGVYPWGSYGDAVKDAVKLRDDYRGLQTAIATYRVLLSQHDFNYYSSSCPEAYAKGQRQYAILQALRENLDPDYKIWDEYIPRLVAVA